MVKIIVSGALGRMGKRIISLAKEDLAFEVIAGLESDCCSDKSVSFKEVDITYESSYIERCQCLIEFSSPQATLEHLKYLVGFKKYKLILAYISFLSLINQSILKNFAYYRFVHIQKKLYYEK